MKKRRNLVFAHDSDYRHMYLRQQVSSLLLHGKLKTHKKWVAAVVRKTDQIITIAKRQDLAATRQLHKFLINHEYRHHQSLIYYTMHVLAIRYKNRTSGFCRRTVIGYRKGDNSIIVLLQLIT